MLGTIKLPHNLKLIQGNLPGSDYDSDKQKKEDLNALNMKKMGSSDEPLDEIGEVNEEEPLGVLSSARKRNYRRPKVQADVFNPAPKGYGKSPSSKALMAKP